MNKIIFVLTVFILSVTSSCGNADTDNNNGEEIKLFQESVKLLNQYTDSMSLAKDTAMIVSLMSRFQDKLNRINNSVAPETDMRLSEGQNDTLATLTQRLLEIKRKRLKLASGELTTDSITSDSIDASHNSYNQSQE